MDIKEVLIYGFFEKKSTSLANKSAASSGIKIEITKNQ